METISLYEACAFIGTIAEMRASGATKKQLKAFEADVLRYLGLRRIPGESLEAMFDRLAAWPDGSIVPRMYSNGIQVEIESAICCAKA